MLIVDWQPGDAEGVITDIMRQNMLYILLYFLTVQRSALPAKCRTLVIQCPETNFNQRRLIKRKAENEMI